MTPSGFTPGPGWGKMKALLNPSVFTPTLNANILKATQFNALLLQKEIRSRIQDRKYAPNASLTIMIKGSMNPLVDHGQLFLAITSHVIDYKTAMVGAFRTESATSSSVTTGEDIINLLETLHDGAVIPVTDAMRHLFFLLWKYTTDNRDESKIDGRLLELFRRVKSRGVAIYPLKPSTTAIRIPPRPFIKDVFEDRDIVSQCRKNWARAIKAAVEKAGG